MEAQPVPLCDQCSSDLHLSEWSVCRVVGYSGTTELGQQASQFKLYAIFPYISAKGVACHFDLCAG